MKKNNDTRSKKKNNTADVITRGKATMKKVPVEVSER